MSSCTKSTRAEEQRWPALSKAEISASATSCSGSALEIGDQRVLAAGLGDERHDRPRPLRQRLIDRARGVGRAGESDAGDARIGDELGADLAFARQKLHHIAGNAGFVQQPDGGGSHKRRLFRRLGDHRIAGGERAGDLAEEDRKRKIPWRDAGKDAAAMQFEQIALAGRSRELGRRDELGAQPRRVVAAMIDRLAHFGNRIGDDAPALAHDKRDEIGHALLQQITGAFEQPRTFLDRRIVPAGRRFRGNRQRALDLRIARLADAADDNAPVGRRCDGARRARLFRAVDDRQRQHRLRRCDRERVR